MELDALKFCMKFRTKTEAFNQKFVSLENVSVKLGVKFWALTLNWSWSHQVWSLELAKNLGNLVSSLDGNFW